MSKPWDKLRKPAVEPPIGLGSWSTSGGTTIRLVKVVYTDIEFEIGSARHSMTTKSASELGEFLIELSKQVEEENRAS